MYANFYFLGETGEDVRSVCGVSILTLLAKGILTLFNQL